MILSDQVTTLTYTGTQLDDFLLMDQKTRTTASGQRRTNNPGRRFRTVERVRLTPSELEELMTLLTNGAAYYYYTPTLTPGYLTATDFPMAVNINTPKKTRHAGGGEKKYHVELEIEGVDYL